MKPHSPAIVLIAIPFAACSHELRTVAPAAGESQADPAGVKAIAAAQTYMRERGGDPLREEWSAKYMSDGTWSVMAWHIMYPNNSGSSRFVPGGHTFYTVSGDGQVLEARAGA
jgi:hypothetical protein